MELAVTTRPDPINPDVGDLRLDAAGREVVLNDVTAEVAQLLHVRFSFFLGEWFLDLDEGTPWIQRVLVKAPTDRVIRTVLTSVLRDCPGVDEILKLSYSISRDRRLQVNFVVRLQTGEVLQSREYGPFIVALDGV